LLKSNKAQARWLSHRIGLNTRPELFWTFTVFEPVLKKQM